MLRSWSLKRLVVRTSTLTAWAAVALLALAGTTSCGATSAAGAASSGATAGPPPKTSTSQLVCSLNGYGYDNPSGPVTLDVTLSTPASAMAGTAIKVRMSTTAAVLPPAVISQLIGVTTFAVKGTVAGRGMATSTVTIKGSTAGKKLASPPAGHNDSHRAGHVPQGGHRRCLHAADRGVHAVRGLDGPAGDHLPCQVHRAVADLRHRDGTTPVRAGLPRRMHGPCRTEAELNRRHVVTTGEGHTTMASHLARSTAHGPELLVRSKWK